MLISRIRGTLVGYARISACTATRASHRPSTPAGSAQHDSFGHRLPEQPGFGWRQEPRARQIHADVTRQAISRFARFAHRDQQEEPDSDLHYQIERRASPTIASCTGSIRSVWSAAPDGRLVGTWPDEPVRSPQFRGVR